MKQGRFEEGYTLPNVSEHTQQQENGPLIERPKVLCRVMNLLTRIKRWASSDNKPYIPRR